LRFGGSKAGDEEREPDDEGRSDACARVQVKFTVSVTISV
jgi:hypothetical protein